MQTQKYSIQQPLIESLLTWVKVAGLLKGLGQDPIAN